MPTHQPHPLWRQAHGAQKFLWNGFVWNHFGLVIPKEFFRETAKSFNLYATRAQISKKFLWNAGWVGKRGLQLLRNFCQFA
jgi:hypothetical protein